MMLSPLAIGAVTETSNLDARRTSTARATGTSSARRSRCTRRASRSTRSPWSTSSTAPARSTRPAARSACTSSAALVPAASNAAPLRADRQRDGDAPRADPRRERHRAARLRSPRRDDRAGRSRRADRLRLSQQRVSTEFAHIDDLLKDSFETITKLYEAGSDITGTPPASAISTASPPASSRATWSSSRRARRWASRRSRSCMAANVAVRARDAGRAVHARDVEGRGDAAAHVRRGQGRVEPPPHGQARRRRLAAPHRGVRQARQGADLRRRHGLDHDDGDPVEAASSEDARAEPRPRDRRLPPADDERHVGREPRAGGLADLPLAQGARPRPRGADHRALPALARRRAAARQAADPLRPARIRLDRAGRRPRDVRLPRRVLQPGRRPTRPASPS